MRAPFSISPADLRKARELEPPAPPLELLLRSGAIHKEKAYIATTLNELATPHVHTGTRIFVVGNDLPSVAAPDYVWAHDQSPTDGGHTQKAILSDWMLKGATVSYFALAPANASVARLQELASHFPKQLKLRQLAITSAGNARAEWMAQLWQQSHFALFENEPQLWVECFHPPQELEARDCFYFPPRLAATSLLYQRYRRDFEWMFEQFGEALI